MSPGTRTAPRIAPWGGMRRVRDVHCVVTNDAGVRIYPSADADKPARSIRSLCKAPLRPLEGHLVLLPREHIHFSVPGACGSGEHGNAGWEGAKCGVPPIGVVGFAGFGRDGGRRRRGKESCMCDDCRTLEQKLAKAHDDMLGVSETMNAQGRELAKLRRELSIEQATSPTAMQVQKALEFWAEGRAGNPNTSPHGGRARLVRQAILLGHTNPALACPVHDEDGRKIRGAPKDAVCTVVDEIIEALAGLKLVPFVGPTGGRISEGVVGAKRYDDVKYALTDRKSGAVSEDTIEHMRGVWRRHKMWSAEKLWQAYLATSEVAEQWLRLAVDAINREQAKQQQAKRADVIDLASRRAAS